MQCRVADLGWGSRALGGKVIGAIREGVRAKGWGGWEAFTSRILFNAHFECFHSQLHCRSSAIKTQTIRKLSRLSRVIYRMFRKCSRCMDSRIFPGSPETFPVWNLSLQFFLYSLETPYCLGGFWVCFTAIAEQFILSGTHYTSSTAAVATSFCFILCSPQSILSPQCISAPCILYNSSPSVFSSIFAYLGKL